eukprot:CAMPEP_0116025300 /NCGR_PEP_ID=MMETSP0321-20121206/12950_1 /TAXON_ID=163516 /ORGANISM="Leptocylindrus danicus var. danicus, Strain B650" /LENGTH=437 /DNA_ID=CAMNT_0003497435 /DNA_START=107 /DNA_END=1420 /DNA_ORIENTATION=-
MESGNIADWKIEEGQAFGPGDVLCEVETDKATVDFEAQDDGVLAKILKPSGSQDIKVGAPVCIVVEDEDDVASFADYNVLDDVSSADDETPAVVASSDTVTEAVVTPSPSRDIEDQYILSPAARHLSQSKGLDATVLTGTGKGGRVTKGDVLLNLDSLPPLPVVSAVPPVAVAASVPVAAAAAAAAATPVYLSEAEVPEPAGSFEDVPNNNMRKVIAKRLTESKRDVPHFYTSVEIELDEVLALRKKLVNDHEVKVSVNDLIIKSSALALRDISAVNATYNDKKSEIVPSDDVDISVAVATPTGLITPIVTGADKRGLSSISSCVKDLATRARDGKLKPEEYQGGTFTISNLGMFGIDEFSAVINPPQAAILAVGGGSPRIIPTPYVEGAEEQEPPKVKTIMTARLSADRRVVDEATAAVFMKAFQEYLSKPHLLSL